MARSLARHNVGIFDEAMVGQGAFDAILVTSAGCSAALREMEGWIGTSARATADATRDVLDFLAEVGLELDLRPLPLRVCYDDPCHLVHAQGVRSAPRALLAAIPELELVAHADPEACCSTGSSNKPSPPTPTPSRPSPPPTVTT